MAYRYQKELDLLEATRSELNITDAQYDELTSKMKDEGNAEWFKPWQEPQVNVPGYEAEVTFTRENAVIKYKIKANNYAWNSFEADLPFEITIGEQLDGNGYGVNGSKLCMYCLDDNTYNGPSVSKAESGVLSGKIISSTYANAVPEQSGQLYGQVICGEVNITQHEPSDADLEQFKKNFKIKIG